MPAYCAVVNCNLKYVHAGRISFHRFPFKRKDLLQKWKDFTQRSSQWMPSKWSAVCSRHFVEDDFSCCNNRQTLKKNAVPTIRLAAEEPESLNVVIEQVTAAGSWQAESNKQLLAGATSTTEITSTCRFCGLAALRCVSFDNSFEVFGMVQKCFPTLQILQDDTLPKDVCSECNKKLSQFSQFIDVVMLAQNELQRKHRRQLKIKLEPVVPVKQEACESIDNLFSDELEMNIDDGCDNEQSANEENEQKYFGDFPMLNAQDIINNCDIMEIINLDDPFINITDDTDGVQSQVSQPVSDNVNTTPLPTPNELLQAELLSEEHNYAKEDWQQTPHQYKTEKVDGNDPLEHLQVQAPILKTSKIEIAPETRSSKPIVTNVSQIPNPLLCELLPSVSTAAPAVATSTGTNSHKPNIVVLNDSVVQSSAAFHLHNCTLCPAKFFTADILGQHYAQTHALPSPIVALPPGNIDLTNGNSSIASLKLESNSIPLSVSQQQPNAPTVTTQTEYWQADWVGNSTQMNSSTLQTTKRKINILDMQRSFLHHNDLVSKLNTVTNSIQLTLPPSLQSHSDGSLIDHNLAAVTANYAKLAVRYQRLKQTCKKLKRNCKWRESRHHCGLCSQKFSTTQQLLEHRKQYQHFVRKQQQHFTRKCWGCAKPFRTRLGLHQHMRYICQFLPLRSARLHNFKCRYCQAITFTHWRIYRRHEIKCRRQLTHFPKKRKRVKVLKSRKASDTCHTCQKIFNSLKGLLQHHL